MEHGGSSREADKISKLPDLLIHHMLSFLDTIYAVRTCVLSKRWRYIWTSLPTLNFDQIPELYSTDEGFVNVVNKVLEHRNNKLYNIQRFHVTKRTSRWHYSKIPLPLDKWIRATFEDNVEDIFIFYSCPDDKTQIPVNLFTCKSLKRLGLQTQVRNMMNLPRYVYLPCLVYLKLEYDFSSGGDEYLNNLISSCPVLEDLDLMLDYCYYPSEYESRKHRTVNIKIHSLSLKHLKIHKYRGRVTLSLYAPNLVSLIFESATDNIDLEDVSSIVSARIDTKVDKCYDPTAAYPQCMLKCLEALRNVKYLTISVAPLKGITGVPEFLENQVSQFRNLRCLKLLHFDFSSSNSIFVIASFLKISPNIESFTLTLVDPTYFAPDSGFYSNGRKHINEMKSDLEILSTTFEVCNLKIFKISEFPRSGIEMKFVEVLLRKANVLEKLYLIDQYDAKILIEVAAMPRASTRAVIWVAQTHQKRDCNRV